MLGTDGYIGGFVSYHDGHLHPLNLCIGEARAAHGLGARIFEQSPVTGIEHGARPTVVTAGGRIQADHGYITAVGARHGIQVDRVVEPVRVRVHHPAACESKGLVQAKALLHRCVGRRVLALRSIRKAKLRPQGVKVRVP